MQQCHYVCRSCLLRLGQPWRNPPRQRPLSQLSPRTPRRANHTLGTLVERRLPEHPEASAQRETDTVRTTDSLQPSNAFDNNGSGPASRRRTVNLPSSPVGLFFRKKLQSFRKISCIPRDTTSRSALQDIDFIKKFDELWGDGASAKNQLCRQSIGHRGNVARSEVQRRFLDFQTERRNVKAALASFDDWKTIFRRFSDSRPGKLSRMESSILGWILNHDSEESMRAAWPALRMGFNNTKMARGRTERRHGRCLMISISTALQYAPPKAPMVLKVLIQSERLPFYIVEDALHVLARHLREMDSETDIHEKQDYGELLANLVVYALEHTPKAYIRLRQNTLHAILEALPVDKLEAWFHRLNALGHPLHQYTQLQFASRLTRAPSTKALALQILQGLLGEDGLDINTPLGASICTSILIFSEEQLSALEENLATPAELFQCLLDMGLIPNVITYTAIIRGLCLKLELRTALEVFQVMKQHGTEPDAYAYSVIMNGCKLCGDFDSMVDLAVEARASDVRDPVIWNDLLHAVFIACLKEPKRRGGPRLTALEPMNAIYTRFFDAGPLKPLITGRLMEMGEISRLQGYFPERIRRARAELMPLMPREVIQPRSDTLGIMILGLVRHMPTPYDVIAFYSHFRDLLRQDHPTAKLLVREQGSLVYDIVLKAVLSWNGTLSLALDIVREMMGVGTATAETPSPPTAPTTQLSEPLSMVENEDAPVADTEATGVNEEAKDFGGETSVPSTGGTNPNATDPIIDAEPEESRPPIQHPRPSVYTWNILMHGFMSNRLPTQAEHILELMQQNGVKPNIVTWNTLAAGYARLQKISNAVGAMRRLETAGFKADDWTLRAFRYIHNKRKAISLMEATVEENRLRSMAVEQQQEELDQQHQQPEPEGVYEEQQEAYEGEENLEPDEEDKLRLHQEQLGVVPDDVSKELYEEIRKMAPTECVESQDLSNKRSPPLDR